MGLTTQEKKVLFFLLALTLLGGAVLIYRAILENGEPVGNHSSWVPLSTTVERKVP
jgi:hypothetical protein